MTDLFVGIFKRSFKEMIRYFMNTISSIIVLMIIYTLIVFGVKSFGGPNAGETLQTTAIGYFVWMSCLFTLTDLSWTIMNEIQRGIIEQEFLSPYGPLIIFAFYEMSNLILTLPITLGLMCIIFWFAGIPLSFNPIFFVFLIMLMIESQSIGFIFAGITLRYKRTNALLQLVQFGVIGLLFVKVSGWESFFIPISPFFDVLKGITEGNAPSSIQPLSLLVNLLVWMIVGTTIFRIFERKVRKLGNLSLY